MQSLNLYNIKALDIDMEGNSMTIKGVNIEDILNEYSTEDIVDALCATSKDADVIDILAKMSEEE